MQDWLLSCSTEINFFQKFFLVPIMLSLKFTANFENLIFLIGVSLLHNVVLVLLYNMIQSYIYFYSYFFRFFIYIDYYRILSRVPCAIV